MRKLHCKETNSTHSEQEWTNNRSVLHSSLHSHKVFILAFYGRPSGATLLPPRRRRNSSFPEAGHASAEALTAAQRLRKLTETEPVPTSAAGTGAAPRPPPPHDRRRTGEGAGKAHLQHSAGGVPGERGPAGCRAPGAVPVPSRRAQP